MASPERVGLAFLGAPAVPEMVRLARRAEETGFDSVWVAETRMTRDGIVPAAALAGATDRIRVGTGIVNVYTRGPVLLAVTFATLDEIAPGRIVMGLGTGSPRVLAAQGVAFERPLRRLREYVEAIRPLLAGEEVTREGADVRLDGARIEDVLAAGGGPARPVPLYLGVTGARAVELAGELADGVLLNVGLPTDYVRRALGWLERGAASAGRDAGEIEVAMLVFVSPHEDREEGRERARRFLALYLSLFPNIARETGADPGRIERLREQVDAGRLDEAADLVGDDLVDLLTAAGTPEECRERLDAYRADGVGLPVLVPADGSIELAIEALAPGAR
jgi:5,10-methylenetetrahydromethanopterin reductase